MEFLDCNISYGPDTMKGQLPGCADMAGLLGQLDRAGISGGLACYAMSEPILGNATLARGLTEARRPGLFGCWTLLPSCTGEIPPPHDLPKLMKKAGVAALTVNPKANKYMPKAPVIGDYLEMASERKIPVLLNTRRGLTLEEADGLMNSFKDLTVILTYENCWPSDRMLRPFLESYPNLCLDLTYMQTAAGLVDIVKTYSASRILFGSGFPECYLGAHMMVIKHAEIDEADKALIAGGNLKALITGADLH